MSTISVARVVFRFALIAVCSALLVVTTVGQCADSDNEEGVIVENEVAVEAPEWKIPTEVLRLQIKYLSADELVEEADRWHGILRKTVRELNEANVEVWYENEKLAAAEAAAEETDAANKSSADRVVQHESEAKDGTLERLGELREQRIQVIDRFSIVLNDLSGKLGLTEDDVEQEPVLQYRRYIDSVKALELDVSDTRSTWVTAVTWLESEEGGMRLASHVGQFLAIVFGFWLLSIFLSKAMSKAMALTSSTSQLLKKFVIDTVRRITIIIGLLLGLAALEINVTPLIALIGATGFVIAFALQDTLSNFASGLMIMLYKPFDIGDFVETSEVAGKVQSMTLVTTNIMTTDNKLMVVPNNELWGKVITNVTHSSERRVDLVFGISYGDDIALAERVLSEVLASHPLVLKEPESVIRVAELADSSVNLICRPWVKTPDYWSVYWDLTRTVKERFDAEGLSIPFPQRDIHLHTVVQAEKES